MAPEPKHDYESKDFLELIEELAGKGYTDKNIAFKLDLTQGVFSRMKNGSYERWNEEENARRSDLIAQALARGRELINSLVRDTYLKSSLGIMKNKSITKRYVEERCPCKGKDKKCPSCGGTGSIVLTDKAVVMETESQAVNLQALASWLSNHDEEWRKAVIESKKLDVTSAGEKISQGFVVEVIDKREQIEKDTDDNDLHEG